MNRAKQDQPSIPPAAAAPPAEAFAMRSAVVEGAADAYLSVRLGDRRVLARRATSCLVEPIAGDRVLVADAAEGGGEVFVLAVLERDAGVATTLATDGDLELAPRGNLVVTAPAGIHLATARDMTISATSLEAVADEASLVWKAVRVVSRALEANIAKVDVTAEASTTLVGRVFSKAKRVFRVVEETETLRAGQLDVVAETNLRMHGDTTLVTATDLVKVDGKQIQLG
jgi:hypothetical protein